jgi:hypothetical protein
MAVNSGADYYLVGRNGAKFYAFAYGTVKGYEIYRPGRTKKGSSPTPASAGSGKGDHLLHPSEYEEEIGLAYGYPLAPSRRMLAHADGIVIDTTRSGNEMTLKVVISNPEYAGLRSIVLSPKSINARLQFVTPRRALDIIGMSQAEVKVVPINQNEPVQATVLITDRTGAMTEIPYSSLQGISAVRQSSEIFNVLGTNDPNPFNSTTNISFFLARAGHVTLTIYNALGQKMSVVVDGMQSAGSHSVTWDATGQSPGVYFYEITSGSWSQTKMMVVR